MKPMKLLQLHVPFKNVINYIFSDKLYVGYIAYGIPHIINEMHLFVSLQFCSAST